MIPIALQRFLTLLLAAIAYLGWASSCLADDPSREHRFLLKKGEDKPVCGAFLKLLDTANLPRNSPICNVPINGSIAGFTPLQYTLLSEEEAESLFPHVYGFVAYQMQQLTTSALHVPSSTIRDWYGANIFAWRYPAVPIANDGIARNILIWQGYGANSNFVMVKCGEIAMVHTQDYVYQPQQLAFVLSPDGKSIDELQTKRLFGLENNYNDTKKPNGLHDFREVGSFVGIFRFATSYYIYALYQENGDYRGQHAADPAITKTIGVLRRANNRTVEECKIQDREHHW